MHHTIQSKADDALQVSDVGVRGAFEQFNRMPSGYLVIKNISYGLQVAQVAVRDLWAAGHHQPSAYILLFQ